MKAAVGVQHLFKPAWGNFRVFYSCSSSITFAYFCSKTNRYEFRSKKHIPLTGRFLFWITAEKYLKYMQIYFLSGNQVLLCPCENCGQRMSLGGTERGLRIVLILKWLNYGLGPKWVIDYLGLVGVWRGTVCQTGSLAPHFMILQLLQKE